jgi:hypothetical protein
MEKTMRNLTGMMTLDTSLALAGSASAQVAESTPTIVLVHGAFTESNGSPRLHSAKSKIS